MRSSGIEGKLSFPLLGSVSLMVWTQSHGGCAVGTQPSGEVFGCYPKP